MSSIKQFRHALTFNLLCLAFAWQLAYSDSVTLNPVADATLSQVEPDNNFGGSDLTSGGSQDGNGDPIIYRALLKFNLTGIPTNAVVTNVALTVRVTVTDGVNSTFELHRMTQAWVENAATWNSPWSSGGADGAYVASASASKAISGIASYTFTSSASLIADAQRWVTNSGANSGWILISQFETTPATIRSFASRENGTATNRPSLVVQYSVPQIVAQPTMTQIRLTNNSFRFSFAVQAGRTYGVEYRGLLGTGSWTTLTNISAQAAPTNIIVLDPLTTSNRYYRVRTP